jgi:hypothetical protein
MSDPCLGCRHLQLCEKLGVSHLNCEALDLDDPDEYAIGVSDEELANNQPWNIVEYRCTETVLDCGDEDDIVSNDEEAF